MGNSPSISQKAPEQIIEQVTNQEDVIARKDIEEIIANNDKDSTIVTNELNSYTRQYPNFPPGFSESVSGASESAKEIENSWKISQYTADIQKLINNTTDISHQLDLAKQEKRALEQAVLTNQKSAEMLKQQTERASSTTKMELSKINNATYREKETMVNRLMYVIYFILYAVALGLAVATGLISKKVLSIGFMLGFIGLMFALFTSGPFLKAYGDLSIGLAKDAVAEIVQIAGPVKSCPAECVVNDSPGSSSSDSQNNYGAPYNYEIGKLQCNV